MRLGVATLLAAAMCVSTWAVPPIAAAAPLYCPSQPHAFSPRYARIPSVSGHRIRVVRVARTSSGALGSPPISRAGKTMIGWDRRRKPGAEHGTVLLDAHTWPDGSALGNRMLRRLRVGKRIRLAGPHGSICYTVTSRREYARDRVPMGRIDDPQSLPRIAIIVCSGKRLGPGNWQRRTVWIATPVVPPT